jgi:hypothetical protein
LNLNKSIAAEQSELARRRNELLISREVSEQETEILILETENHINDYPEWKRALAIKQR